MNWALPVIDLDRCTGCGQCVRRCPTRAVELIDRKAVIVRPSSCTYCDACERACSTGAIGRPFMIMFDTSQQRRSA
ncbi:ATP-binding protein [Roseiflexus sp.]|uniref:ATP-binding protein n=1 Tax=Roseiflexus sp. TaxID=2562120 RepID=UPI00398A9E83